MLIPFALLNTESSVPGIRLWCQECAQGLQNALSSEDKIWRVKDIVRCLATGFNTCMKPSFGLRV